MTEYCFLNREILPLKEARVSVLDIGLERGYGIYDGLTAIGDKIFRFEDHWARFVRGAQALGLNIPITQEKAEKVTKELLSKNNRDRSVIRIILTGGPTIAGIEFDFENPTFYILVENHVPLSAEIYQNGGKLITYPFKRDLPEYKTTNYIRAVNLQKFRKEEGAVEILYTFEGEVFECATSNVFLVKDNVLITPDEGVLGGITRKVVLELADGKYKIERRVVEENELAGAEEVFITSSFKDILPITQIDDYKIADGEPGPVTRELMAQFAKVLNS